MARGVRVTVVVVPFVASVVFAWVLSSWLPAVSSVWAAVGRWLLIAVASTSVMVGFDRLARRLLPLAALLSLTLAFPDQAPSRFKLAMRSGTTLQLRRVIADARAGRLGDTPAEAAEKLLELVAALSLHDRLTRGHSERVRAYTHMVGEELKITGAELDHLRWAALLHDIGKLLVSAEILNKPGRLTDAEFDTIKMHPEFGRQLVAPLVGWLGDASRAVWEHHERWDGGGYPRGLAGTEISLAGRIVAVTDAFDVMTSARSYKDPISPVAARAELARCAGSHFDSVVVRAFLNVSLGRLRMAMGPLSWLTQLSFVPQALVTAGATGATAMTAVVGLGAGALGVGLSDNGVIAAADTEQAASPPSTLVITTTPTDPEGTVGAGSPSIPPGDPTAPPTTSTGPPGPDAASTTSSTPTGAAPPTSLPDGPPGPTSNAPTTTSPAPAAAPATSTTDPAPATSTTDPPPATTTAATPTTVDPPPSTTPTTTPTTTKAPTTTATITTTTTTTTATTTTTTAPPPAPMGDMTWYLTSPGTGDVPAQDVVPLATTAPTDLLVANYDTNRNSDPGLTLVRGGPGTNGRQRFRWEATSLVELQGSAGVSLWLAGPGLLDTSDLVIDVHLRRCAADDCAIVASRRASSPGPLLGLGLVWATVDVDLGAVDVVLAPGEALEVVVIAPSDSSRNVWLAYDTIATPSRLTFDAA